jgi:hypothetical protein
VSITEEIDARKEKIDEAAAWALLKDAEKISVAKGKKVQVFENVAAEKEAVLKNAMGPSGNLRAPTYRIGKQFIIGFNPDLYEGWVK